MAAQYLPPRIGLATYGVHVARGSDVIITVSVMEAAQLALPSLHTPPAAKWSDAWGGGEGPAGLLP